MIGILMLRGHDRNWYEIRNTQNLKNLMNAAALYKVG